MKSDLKTSLAEKIRSMSLLFVLIAAAAGSVWAVFAVPGPIVDRMLEADVRKQAELWQRRIVLHMADPGVSFENGTVQPHDAHMLSLFTEETDVYRFRLLTNSGEIFWSSRSDEIGDYEANTFFTTQVAKGKVYYMHEVLPAYDVDGLTLPTGGFDDTITREVARVYMPLIHNGHFDGAIDFYTDITDLRNTFINRVQLSLLVLTSIALLAMTIAVYVVFKTNRFRMNQLRQRNETEREILDEQLRLAREVQLLGELNEWLQSSRSLDELFDMVARFMTHILPTAEGSVYVYSNSRDVLDGCASWNGGSHKDHIHPEECWGLRRGRTYEFGSSEIDFVCEHAEPHDGRAYYCFPILAHGETVGLMHLRALSDATEEFISSKKLAQMCAEQISMAIANVRMRDQLHDQSVRDPLTGLFNRRHMTETLRKSIGNSQNSGTPLSIIAVDVDHFKKFNDNHGHDAGDMVLRAVGSVLEQACDGDEVACRPGGEEFTLILPGASQEDVMTKAELLRQAVEAIVVRYGEKALPGISISLGVAHYPRHGTMPQDLLRASDEALYEAKAKGRNQVCVASSAEQAPRDPGAQKHRSTHPKPDGPIAAE
ncbi:sensor domain-containing diguanylate cyclase [Phaeobacter inhibens]|uniref:sensor domain-containing diguanylate cyclase n=1 Tax=Phaeobacter inhibens TaxID=221822 RepID=UPI000163290F|nr:diguanylate cyclase [Phaeobacter inhibens]AFO90663.1 diguanylate cyclase (GGDEF) domain-containing protein [Phaeobacter inhibens DSM 17395]AUQ45314.1 diguanylate cyclase (GGDEF) domain-containing protein [Phaeobacter inhibens]AUR07159.1 diguanylate cyclase (GGDEF) domain-containing protein [Phaeobacter inhibens]AUR10935.1 diguanylate cyclase (GGDEF) domain-containing protein [Phaeobacter inhibens]AXT22168.1 sensor domain-containing diguanylate cyclase [Phaeobacter inhibens]